MPHPVVLSGDTGCQLAHLQVSSPPLPELALASCSAPESQPRPLPHAQLPNAKSKNSQMRWDESSQIKLTDF